MKSFILRNPSAGIVGKFEVGKLYKTNSGIVILCSATEQSGEIGKGIILVSSRVDYPAGEPYHMGAAWNVTEFSGAVSIEN